MEETDPESKLKYRWFVNNGAVGVVREVKNLLGKVVKNNQVGQGLIVVSGKGNNTSSKGLNNEGYQGRSTAECAALMQVTNKKPTPPNEGRLYVMRSHLHDQGIKIIRYIKLRLFEFKS